MTDASTWPSALRDDRAVSAVLGAMILAGILMLGVVTYEAEVVPQLRAQAQDQHLRSIARTLATLAVELDQQAANRSQAAATYPVPIGYDAPGLVSDSSMAGGLTFEPEAESVSIFSKELLIQQENASQRITQPEAWNEVNGSGSIEDVSQVASLRLKFDRIAREMAGDHVVVNITDADGEHAGSFRVCLARHSPDWDLHTLVKDADGTILYNNAHSYFQNQEYEPFWINVLNPDYRFGQLLTIAEEPFDLSVEAHDDAGAAGGCPGDGADSTSTGELEASYAITYLEATDAGTVVQGGGGLVREDYNRTVEAGRLTYEVTGPGGQHRLVLEHGALILAQSEGNVFRLPPDVDAGLSDNIVTLSFNLPRLTGDPSSATGTSSAVVRAVPESSYRLEGQATNLTINLTTDHPGLWVDRWDEEFDEAGLGGEVYDVENGSSWARLEVWGLLGPSPSSDELDLFVRLHETPIQLRIEG